jgi:microcystin-dependent protein
MSEPFLSEIKIVSFNFPPKGWALCNGQFLPINQNQALFALLGTTYGGNGQTTFALPNLRGQVPIHMGNGHTLGEAAGSTSVTINIQQLPTHLHLGMASATQADQATLLNPNNNNSPNILAAVTGAQYVAPQSLTTLEPSSVTSVGGNQPHNNMMPYLVLNFIIALQGIFPSRN